VDLCRTPPFTLHWTRLHRTRKGQINHRDASLSPCSRIYSWTHRYVPSFAWETLTSDLVFALGLALGLDSSSFGWLTAIILILVAVRPPRFLILHPSSYTRLTRGLGHLVRPRGHHVPLCLWRLYPTDFDGRLTARPCLWI